jgi:hypothetical protein
LTSGNLHPQLLTRDYAGENGRALTRVTFRVSERTLSSRSCRLSVIARSRGRLGLLIDGSTLISSTGGFRVVKRTVSR